MAGAKTVHDPSIQAFFNSFVGRILLGCGAASRYGNSEPLQTSVAGAAPYAKDPRRRVPGAPY